jgi:hypothetical protein
LLVFPVDLSVCEGRPDEVGQDRGSFRPRVSSLHSRPGGGCKGLAMLNRTNRTLSANLLGLNLGTRSLVLIGNGNDGSSIQHARHAHDCAMRAGMPRSSDPSIRPYSRIAITGIPGSSKVVSWPAEVPSVRRPAFAPFSFATSFSRDVDQRQSRPQSQSDCVKSKRKSKKDSLFGKMLASGGARLRARGATAAAAGANASAAAG